MSKTKMKLTDFKRDFLLALIDNPLPAEFVPHLKPASRRAFDIFKDFGLVELAVIDNRYRVTNAGRRAIRLQPDPQID